MVIRDQELERIVNNKIPVNINNKLFTVVKNPTGSCNGCYFYENNEPCASKAVCICCSNGGNVLKLVDDGK